jgi:hypothetical protein
MPRQCCSSFGQLVSTSIILLKLSGLTCFPNANPVSHEL